MCTWVWLYRVRSTGLAAARNKLGGGSWSVGCVMYLRGRRRGFQPARRSASAPRAEEISTRSHCRLGVTQRTFPTPSTLMDESADPVASSEPGPAQAVGEGSQRTCKRVHRAFRTVAVELHDPARRLVRCDELGRVRWRRRRACPARRSTAQQGKAANAATTGRTRRRAEV